MTLNTSASSTLRSAQSARTMLLTAGTGLSLVLAMTACQPESPVGSPTISTLDLESTEANQFPAISQELEVDLVTTTSAAPVTSVTTLPPTTAVTSTTNMPSSTTSTAIPAGSTDAHEIPGAALDYGPPAGASLDVVGVRHDDVLNFRVDPDPTSDVVASVAPIREGHIIIASGQAWIAPSGIWWKVTVNGEPAWANQSYLAGVGHGDDFFIDVAEALGVLRFETITDAAQAVAGTQASETPESRVVVVAAPVTYDSGAGMTIDVLDLGDDSLKGLRIWIEVEFIYDDSGETVESVVLTDVYMNPLCGRGSEGAGLCL